jgi:hypothetical protein
MSMRPVNQEVRWVVFGSDEHKRLLADGWHMDAVESFPTSENVKVRKARLYRNLGLDSQKVIE